MSQRWKVWASGNLSGNFFSCLYLKHAEVSAFNPDFRSHLCQMDSPQTLPVTVKMTQCLSVLSAQRDHRISEYAPAEESLFHSRRGFIAVFKAKMLDCFLLQVGGNVL